MPRIIVTLPDSKPQPYKIPSDLKTIAIGRDSSCDIVIDHMSCSSQHAEIRKVSGGYLVKDTHSTNGIKIKGKRKPIIDLDRPRTFTAGDVSFEVSFSDEELSEFEKDSYESREDEEKKDESHDEEAKKEKKVDSTEVPTTALKTNKKTDSKEKAQPALQASSQPAPKQATASAVHEAQNNNGFVNFLGMIVFIIIGALAFLFGMSKKHDSLGGSDFFGQLFNKEKTVSSEVSNE